MLSLRRMGKRLLSQQQQQWQQLTSKTVSADIETIKNEVITAFQKELELDNVAAQVATEKFETQINEL